MTISEHGYPLAAAVTPRLHVMETADSTNAVLLADAAADLDGHPHLSVVLTRDQRAGKGRLGRQWTAPPGSAIAMSVLLEVAAVDVADRGWIPLSAGVAVTRAVASQLPSHDASLKWPNDVLVDGQKISGILTEVLAVRPTTVVVGIGINTAMTTEDLPVPTATSFAARGVRVDEDRLVADVLVGLRDLIAALAVGGPAAVRDDVRAACATIGARVAVNLPDGSVLRGEVRDLDADGRLVVVTADGETSVAAGDVVHVR